MLMFLHVKLDGKKREAISEGLINAQCCTPRNREIVAQLILK